MTRLPASPFSLDLTLESGQVFHWEKQGTGHWRGLIGCKLVEVQQDPDGLALTAGDPDRVARYFALDHPLDEIYASFPDDDLSRAALTACRGMRIIRQPKWECTATFITSSMKQVAHIRAMSLEIRRRYGTPVAGSDVEAYPDPAALARCEEEDLRACGLGYRAANLVATARKISDGHLDLEALAALPTDDLRSALETLPGVGRKVANCILLFAYERLDAVPIDVWIGRILLAMRRGRRGTPGQLARYARRRLGPVAGYVQQYLFHHARVSRKFAP
ncbi:MAG: DNA glycosylase [Terrimicrobiaceae bacterium]|nr:DNA glycosylase [Terrimicrobiaceae bacterium]